MVVQGIFAALPFAVWFYLGIEGVAMVAEEVHEPTAIFPVVISWVLLRWYY